MASASIRPPKSESIPARFNYPSPPGNPDSTQPRSALSATICVGRILFVNAEPKKLKARDEFIHFTETFLEEKFGKLNTVQQSFALTHFYIKEIRNRIGS